MQQLGDEMKNDIRSIILAATVLSLVGCATTQAPSGGGFSAKQISTASYGKKADTFVIIQDASSSMNNEHMDMGHSKLDVSRETLSNMNQTIPPLDFNAGLSGFGDGYNNGKVLYSLTNYSRDGLGNAIASLTSAGGPTPMSSGINTANGKQLSGLGLGKIALFIVSDGIPDSSHHSGSGGEQSDAIDAAKKIKDQLGNSVCIYPIQVGKDPDGQEFMNKLAKAGGCGFATHAEDINSPDSMAGYVIKTLLGPVAAAAVDTSPEKIILSTDALFDFDRAVLKPKGKQSLDNLITRLSKVKYDVIVAVGHTDRLGSADYNKKLSVKRAEAVKSYLVTTHGIDTSSVFVDGKGETSPVTGTTCKGKGKELISCLQPDRRVEIEIAGVRE